MKKILFFYPNAQSEHFYFNILKSKLEQSFEIKIVKCLYGLLNVMNIHKEDEGLDYFDIIIMDMYFNPDPLFSYEETDSGLCSGWFLYDKLLRNIEAKIIIWSHNTYNYFYPNLDYPERNWENNVIFLEKNLEDENLIHLLEMTNKEIGSQ